MCAGSPRHLGKGVLFGEQIHASCLTARHDLIPAAPRCIPQAVGSFSIELHEPIAAPAIRITTGYRRLPHIQHDQFMSWILCALHTTFSRV